MHDEYLADIRRQQLSLDFAEIHLTPTSEASDASPISGQGQLSTDVSNGCFRISIEPSQQIRDYSKLTNGFFNLPGRYNLEAVADNDSVWRAQDIPLHQWVSTIFGRAYELEVTTPNTNWENVYRAEMIFARVKKLLAIDTVVITTEDSSRIVWRPQSSLSIGRFNLIFENVKDDDSLKVSVESDSPINTISLSRISESLIFLLGYDPGRIATSSVTERTVTTKFRVIDSGRIINPRPPVDAANAPEDFWRLFERYLHFVLADTRSRFHPMSRYLWSTILSANTLTDIDGLTIAVVVEGLLLNQFKAYATTGDQFKHDIEKVSRALNFLCISGSSKTRIHGALQGMKRNNAGGALRNLVQAGLIDKSFQKAWDDLRNPRAHGTFHGSERILEMADLNHKVLQLLYHLVFLAIGYTGSYIDYTDQPPHFQIGKNFDKQLPRS